MSSHLDSRLIEVGYFLSRLGLNDPPIQLMAENWKEAYSKFYGTFGINKTEEEFKNSLKNLRDHFDSHLKNSRIGWMGGDGKPQKLSSSNQDIYDKLQKLNDEELWEYIKPLAVTSYKSKVAKIKNDQIIKNGAKYFSSEFSGKKKIRGNVEGEAIVFHGKIVDSLKVFVEKNFKYTLVFNNQKIDLAIEYDGRFTEIFEVKTSNDTQSIYTAVGQLYMHSVGAPEISKYIVLPDASDNKELIDCLSRLNINILWLNVIDDLYVFKFNKPLKP